MFHAILESILNVLFMFSAGGVLLFIVARLKGRELRLLSATLSIFAISHGLFHLAFFLEQPALALGILQPLSALFLLAFAFMLLRRG